MSTANFRFFVIAVFAIALSGFQACGQNQRASDQNYQNFLQAVQRAPEEGWTPYWLGRSFSAGGLTFEGPSVPDFGAEIEGGGISLSYIGAQSVANFDVAMFSQAAWMYATQHRLNFVPASVESKPVSIGAHPGTLYVARGAGGVVAQLHVDVQIGDTMISISTNREPEPRTNRDLNPLTDEATFLSVLQNLRPYPE